MFDDDVKDEDETGPTYLGLAQVSLQPLSQGKPISGTFQLKQVYSILQLAYMFVGNSLQPNHLPRPG